MGLGTEGIDAVSVTLAPQYKSPFRYRDMTSSEQAIFIGHHPYALGRPHKGKIYFLNFADVRPLSFAIAPRKHLRSFVTRIGKGWVSIVYL